MSHWHWDFILPSYIIAVGSVGALFALSFVRMVRAERAADEMRRRGRG